MRVTTSARLTTACLLAGALACASNTARVDDETAAAQDTTSTEEVPPGYSGMERDTAMTPDTAATAVDTFLEEQGTGVPADTQGYGGLEHPDTTGGAAKTDTSGYGQQPSGQTGYDTTGYGQQPGQTGGVDTTGQTGGAGYGADTTTMGTGMDTTGAGTDTTGTWQQDSVSQ